MMSYDPYEEAQERYADEYDRRRDEAKGQAPPNRAAHPARQVGKHRFVPQPQEAHHATQVQA
jgi:hypothetical protein